MAIVKNLAFGEDARSKLIEGIDKISNAVKSTLGARGKTVLIESENHIGGLVVTKDGITVAKSIFLNDPIENLAVALIRQASDLTSVQAGDGTTTSVVITQALVHEAQKLIKPHMNQTLVIRHLRTAADIVLDMVKEIAVPVDEKNLVDVATVSANGDEALGKMIADAYQRVNLKGSVLIEKSKTPYSYSEVTEGLRINRGWTSKYFLTDAVKQECVLNNPLILVTDKKIENLMTIKHLIEPCMEDGRGVRPFLIIGEVSEQVMEAMNYNIAKGIIQFAHILSPSMGYKGSEMLEDIAIATGGRYFSEGSGDNMELMTAVDLGTAKKVVIGYSHTIIFPNDDEYIKSKVDSRIEELEQRISEETDANEKDYLKQRRSNLSGGVAIAYIGAVSGIEYGELRDRADDCTSAVSAAIDGGIVSGGGVALLSIAKKMNYGHDEESRVAWHILKNALEAPINQILENGGFKLDEIDKGIVGVNGMGFDVAKGEVVDMIKSGIVDPCKVVCRCVDNAVSVASTILSTNAIITNVRANVAV